MAADGTTPTNCKRTQRLIAMKGHPGSGKSTLARALARKLGCPLIDKDDIRDCTVLLDDSSQQGSTRFGPKLPSSVLNALSYEVMWQVASTQLAAGLTVVVDCPLARPALFTCAQATAGRHGAELVVVECRCSDVEQWKSRLQGRAMAAEPNQPWHKPANWEEMEKILDSYSGCWEYATGCTPKLVVDTTAVTAADAEASALQWLHKLDMLESA